MSDKNIPFKIYNKSSSKRKERSVPEHSERNVGYYEEKLLGLFLLCSIALAGCSSPSDSDDRTETQMEPQENAETQTGQSSSVLEEPENILVAYFSWADNAVLDDDVDAVSSPSVIPPGNVQQLAGWVQEETGEICFPSGDRSISQRLG